MNPYKPPLRDRNPPHFYRVGDCVAYIAVTKWEKNGKKHSACIFSVRGPDGEVHEPDPFASEWSETTIYRAGIAALRGVVEAVAHGSKSLVVTDNEPLCKAFYNKEGRKEQTELWDQLDATMSETGTSLTIQMADKGDPTLKALKKRLAAWRKCQ